MIMKKGLLVALVATAVSSSAMAIDLKFTGTTLSNAESVKISVNGSSFKSVFAGELKFSTSGGSLSTYCVDALSPLGSSAKSYTVSELVQTSSTGLGRAASILANHQASAITAAQQAGLQLAIWEALYDGGSTFNANSAGFKVTGASSAALSFASTYYNSFDNPTNLDVTFYCTNQAGGQSQITAVPEPMTFATLGVGLVALVRRRRK